MVCSNLSSLAVRLTHSSSPKGRPLSMLTRTRPNSFALSGAFTRSVQPTGRSTGQGDKMALIASSPCILAHRPLQHQCSARATNPAPTAFRSMYCKTVNRWSSLCTGKLREPNSVSVHQGAKLGVGSSLLLPLHQVGKLD